LFVILPELIIDDRRTRNKLSSMSSDATRMKAIVVLLGWWLCRAHSSAEDTRILIENAKVNGAPARMFFDTGAGRVFLFSDAAERLGLKVSPIRSWWSKKSFMATEKCTVDLWHFSRKERLAVVTLPPYLHGQADGVVGWNAVSKKILVFDTLGNNVRFVSEVPKEAKHWTKFRAQTWRGILALKVTGQS